MAQLRAALKQPHILPEEVVRSLTESREAIAELTRNLHEQEAVTAALRAECNAYRDSADNASEAAHGAMVAALRAQRAAGGSEANRRRPLPGAPWGGGSSSASMRSESLSPSSTAASRIMQNGESALASVAAGGGPSWPREDRDGDGGSTFGGGVAGASGAATTIARLRATVASRDATIAALRSECSELGGQIAALQVRSRSGPLQMHIKHWHLAPPPHTHPFLSPVYLQAELAVYRKVDVYSVTLHKEMKAMSSRHASGLPIGGH